MKRSFSEAALRSLLAGRDPETQVTTLDLLGALGDVDPELRAKVDREATGAFIAERTGPLASLAVPLVANAYERIFKPATAHPVTRGLFKGSVFEHVPGQSSDPYVGQDERVAAYSRGAKDYQAAQPGFLDELAEGVRDYLSGGR